MWLKTLLWKQKWFWSENWVIWAQPYWFEHFPLSWSHLKAPLNWVCTRFAQDCRVIYWASVTTWTLSWRIWMVLNMPKESTFQNPHAILNWMDCFCNQENINLLMIFHFLYVLLALLRFTKTIDTESLTEKAKSDILTTRICHLL